MCLVMPMYTIVYWELYVSAPPLHMGRLDSHHSIIIDKPTRRTLTLGCQMYEDVLVPSLPASCPHYCTLSSPATFPFISRSLFSLTPLNPWPSSPPSSLTGQLKLPSWWHVGSRRGWLSSLYHEDFAPYVPLDITGRVVPAGGFWWSLWWILRYYVQKIPKGSSISLPVQQGFSRLLFPSLEGSQTLLPNP